MSWFPALDLQQKPLRDLNQNYTSIWAMQVFWVLSCGSEEVTQAHLAPSAKSRGLFLALPLYSSVNQASQPAKVRAVSRHMGWVQWQQVRSCPSFLWSSGSTWEQGGWRAPSLQPLAIQCVSYKNVLAAAQTAGEGNVCPRHGSSPRPGQNKVFVQLTTWTESSRLSSCHVRCARAGARAVHTKESISDELTANVAGCKWDWKSEASQGQAQRRWEHKAGPDCKCHVQIFAKIRKWRNNCVLLHFVKLSHHKQWHRVPAQDRAYQGLVLANQQE